VTVPPPDFVAVTATVSPSAAPKPEIAGVASFVTLSVDDEPVSEAGNKSGAGGAAGGVESTVMFVPGPAGETLPEGSVIVPSMVHEPSDIAGRSQLFTEGDCTYVQDTTEPSDFRPLIVMVSPTTAPGIETSGVESDVMLSVFDVPESDAGSKSGVDGALGGVASIEMSRLGPAVETLPAGSATVADIDHVPSDIVGRSQLVTVDDAT
jgi:hypothetical protein